MIFAYSSQNFSRELLKLVVNIVILIVHFVKNVICNTILLLDLITVHQLVLYCFFLCNECFFAHVGHNC